jgi:nitroreductase
MPQPDPSAFAFLSSRRSVPAKLMGPPVPDRAALEPILAAALRVPDHGKLEPWRLVVLARPALLRLGALAAARAAALSLDSEQAAKGRAPFDIAHLAVAVVASPKPSAKIPPIEQMLSAGAVCLGLVNAATSAGWGACWLTGWPAHDRGFVEAGLGLRSEESLAGFVHIGTPLVTLGPDRPRPDLAAVTAWVGA